MSDLTTLIITWGWLVLTGLGVVVTAVVMYQTRSDLTFLHINNINGAVEATTKLAFGNSLRAFVILTLLFLIGVASLFVPHVPSTREHPAGGPYNWMFVSFLYLTVILFDYSAFAVFRFRRRWLQGRAAFQTHTDLENQKGGV